VSPVVAVIMLIAWGIALWAGVFFIIPAHMCSLFRYRIWQIRDRFADLLISGELPACEATRVYLTILEGTIDNASDLTAVGLRVWCSFRSEAELLPAGA
jgi:hypothetical protein